MALWYESAIKWFDLCFAADEKSEMCAFAL